MSVGARRADGVASTVKQVFGAHHEYFVSGRGASLMLPAENTITPDGAKKSPLATTPTQEIDNQGKNQAQAFKDYQDWAESHGESHERAEKTFGRTANEPEDRRVTISIAWHAHTIEWTGAAPPAKK